MTPLLGSEIVVGSHERDREEEQAEEKGLVLQYSSRKNHKKLDKVNCARLIWPYGGLGWSV